MELWEDRVLNGGGPTFTNLSETIAGNLGVINTKIQECWNGERQDIKR